MNFENTVVAEYEDDSAVLTDTELFIWQPFERVEPIRWLSELRIDNFL